MVINGVTVYNPLPSTHFLDVSNECIVTIGGEVDDWAERDVDRVVKAGTLPNGVAWGITNRVDGFADIVIDSTEVTEETLRQLIAINVVTRP
jgi:hypothetical protein